MVSSSFNLHTLLHLCCFSLLISCLLALPEAHPCLGQCSRPCLLQDSPPLSPSLSPSIQVYCLFILSSLFYAQKHILLLPAPPLALIPLFPSLPEGSHSFHPILSLGFPRAPEVALVTWRPPSSQPSRHFSASPYFISVRLCYSSSSAPLDLDGSPAFHCPGSCTIPFSSVTSLEELSHLGLVSSGH